MSQSGFDEFFQLTMRNLKKNGFPANAVSFSMDRMYEEADKRGFSFNKVRDHLRQNGIESELVNNKVVFRSVVMQSNDPEMAEMQSAAQQLLSKLSTEDREKLLKMVRDMSPEQMETAQKQWESMSADEKKRVVQEMGKN